MTNKNNNEAKQYEENFNKLKQIAEELKQGALGVDELVNKGKDASNSAKICLDILKTERGNFKTIEEELSKISDSIKDLMSGE